MSVINKKHLPNIGQKIYTLNPYLNYHLYAEDNIVESIITGVVVDSDGYIILYLDFETFSYRVLNRNKVWFSRKRAKNVFNQQKKQYFSREKKELKRYRRIDKLQNDLPELEKKFTNKIVEIKISGEDRKTTWFKTRVGGLKLDESKKGYALNFYLDIDIFKNIYLLKKENVTWRFVEDKKDE